MMSRLTNLGFSRRQKTALTLAGYLLAIGFALDAHAQANPATALPNGGLFNAQRTPNPGQDDILFANQPSTGMRATTVAWEPDEKFMLKTVEPDLSLLVRYNYVFRGALQTLAPSKVEVPDGWYAVTAVILLADLEENGPTPPADRYVTSAAPTFVLVQKGEFRDLALSFPFYSLPATAMKDSLVMEFVPLEDRCYPRKHVRPGFFQPCVSTKENGDPDASRSRLHVRRGFKPFTFSLPFVPLIQTGSYDPKKDRYEGDRNIFRTTLREFARNETREQFELRRATTDSRPTPETYAAAHKLKLIGLDDAGIDWAGRPATGWIPGIARFFGSSDYTAKDDFQKELRRILLQPALSDLNLKVTDGFASAVCRLAYRLGPKPMLANDHRSISQCRTEFLTTMRLTRIVHAGLVDTVHPPQRVFNPYVPLGLSANAIKSRSYSEDTSQSTNIGYSVQVLPAPLKFVEKMTKGLVGVSVSGGQSHTKGTSQSDAKIEQGVLSAGDLNDFNPLVLRVKTMNSRACLQILPNDASRMGAVYICSNPIPRLDLLETYAHVYSTNKNTSLVDQFERGSQIINRQLRGDAEITEFFWSMRNGITAHNDSRFPQTFTQSAVGYMQSNPLFIPGLSVTPVIFNDEVVPSWMGLLFYGEQQKFMQDNPAPRID